MKKSSAPGGIATKGNLKQWAGYASKGSFARGGAVPMKGGADSGVGRLNKVKAYNKGTRAS